MTPFQFYTVSAFVVVCIIVTYMNSRRLIAARKQRDVLAGALASLMCHINDVYPEAVHIDDEKMIAGRKAIASLLRSEK